VPISSTSTQLLLAYLALHPNQGVDRRKTAFLLWADHGDSEAQRYLRQHLHRLRQVLASLRLPEDILVSRGNHLYLQPEKGLWIDVLAFRQQLQKREWQIEAIELYEGDLLPHVDGEWVRPFRTQLREQYLEAVYNQIRWAKMQHNYPRALHYAQRLLQANPLRESSHRIYMEILCLSGRRAQALQHFTHLRQLLRQELKAQPMPETIELYQQMKNGTLPDDTVLLVSSPKPIFQAPPPSDEEMLTRRKEIARLDEALAHALAGRGCFILLQGEASVGKSYLLGAWRRLRRNQLLHFSAGCVAGPATLPGQPLLAALRQGRHQIDWTWFPSQLWWHDPLRRTISGAADGLGASNGDASKLVSVLGQFALLLARQSGQVVGFFLDDLHQADEATWHTLAFIGRRCHTLPLLLLGTYHPDRLTPRAERVVHSLQRRGQVDLLRLLPPSPSRHMSE
jgi:DNA-binding SARP family transcriptional activator